MKKEGGEGSYSKDMLRWDVEAWVRIANQRLASIKERLQTPSLQETETIQPDKQAVHRLIRIVR